jgi:hypothetical protein
VREESHLDEMRSAIRGDFQRLAERRGEQELMRVVEAQGEAGHDEAPDPALADDSDPERGPEQQPVETRSWLARFLSP